MTKVYRVSRFHQGRVEGHIDDVWALVMDWGSLAWYDDSNNTGGMKVFNTWLEGQPGVIPRTRVMSRGEGAAKHGTPIENREVLLVADPVAHRLYYDATDGFAPGIRNYMASWCFDELEDGGCMMTISSNFDVVPASAGEENAAMLQQVYVSIVSSLDRHFRNMKSKG